MLVYLGLILVIMGWIFQLMSKSNKIQKHFVLTYAAGVFLLVVDGYQVGLLNMAILNLVALAVAILVYFQLKK